MFDIGLLSRCHHCRMSCFAMRVRECEDLELEERLGPDLSDDQKLDALLRMYEAVLYV